MQKTVEIVLNGSLFEWDERKDKLNKIKHGISFRAAAYVFTDDKRIEIYDDIHSIDEDRYIVIGKINKVLFVIYTERKNSIRIISARLATAVERRLYYGRD